MSAPRTFERQGPLGRTAGPAARRALAVSEVAWAAAAGAAVVALGSVGLGAASVAGPSALRWVAGGLLLVLIVVAGAVCAHAGGHAVVVLLPAVIVGVVWAVAAARPHPAAGWWLVALSAAVVCAGATMAATAARQQWRAVPGGSGDLAGAEGVALTALGPDGVVRVGRETWSARSLSGPLPAGVPIHVVRLAGVRLDVWSEAGTVPDGPSVEPLAEPEGP